MKISENYSWLIETSNGETIKKYNPDGSMNRWQNINTAEIIRVSFQPSGIDLPKHEVFIDIDNGNRFIKYFGRGFLKQKYGFEISNYVFCVATKQFRSYVTHTGEMIITPKDYELRL